MCTEQLLTRHAHFTSKCGKEPHASTYLVECLRPEGDPDLVLAITRAG